MLTWFKLMVVGSNVNSSYIEFVIIIMNLYFKCFLKEIYYEELFKVLLIRDLYESVRISAFYSSRSEVAF